MFWLSALCPLSFISVFCAVFKNELTHIWASLCLWKIQCLNRKLSLRDLSPACEASLWMGPIVSLSFELGTMGALLRVSWSNLTSCRCFTREAIESGSWRPSVCVTSLLKPRRWWLQTITYYSWGCGETQTKLRGKAYSWVYVSLHAQIQRSPMHVYVSLESSLWPLYIFSCISQFSFSLHFIQI